MRRALACLATVFALLLPVVRAQAAPQAPAGPVALWPLDSRPVTSVWPGLLAQAASLDLRVPPGDWLGTATQGADAGQLVPWLDGNTPGLAIVSLDGLAYGGLVQSRQAGPSLDEAWARLQPLRDWHERTGVPVWAFVVIPRQPEAKDVARNLGLIERALDWVQDGTLARLVIGWDDALGSAAPKQGAALRAEAARRGLGNVAVYAGADEIASTLVARFVLERAGLKPSARLITDDVAAAARVFPYDGAPLMSTFSAQAAAVGFQVSASAPGVTVFVRTSLDPREAALRVMDLERRGATALVDLEKVNGFNWPWLENMRAAGALPDLAGLAGWGTPGNNVGWVLAEAAVSLVAPREAFSPLLALGYVNDGLYSSVLRSELRAEGWLAGPQPDPRADPANPTLLERVREALPRSGVAVGKDLDVTAANFPWARTFEVAVNVTLTPHSPAANEPRLQP